MYGVQLGCLGRMMAFLGRCSALLENMRHVMRFQSIQDALPNRSSTKPRRLGTVQDGRYGAFLQHARWSVSGDSSNPACGGSAINRLYTPCTRKRVRHILSLRAVRRAQEIGVSIFDSLLR
jgi:hypothetical protein